MDLKCFTKLIESAFPGFDKRQFLFLTEHLWEKAYVIMVHVVVSRMQKRYTPMTWNFNKFSLELATILLTKVKLTIESFQYTITSRQIIEANRLLAGVCADIK